ncbi:MAG TPA: hypothetical protein VHR66_01690 [Gemmataceae bacterium]|nr:hypothetical protein [Gemmataceae bacterium]
MFEYLVTYGQGSFLGRFRADENFTRDDTVVVHSDRGIEIGTIRERAGGQSVTLVGEVIRRSTDSDSVTARGHRHRVRAILTDAQSSAEALGLPLLFLDGEILLDGLQAILQAIHWAECDATPVFEQLSQRHRLLVKVADLTATPQAAKTGCSTCGAEKSGCDSCGTGGGCSTGSCSKGSVKNADELTAYFAGLRKQMEAAGERVSLH